MVAPPPDIAPRQVALPPGPGQDGRVETAAETEPAPLTMFTTTWCGFCVRLKAQLAREGIAVTEIDIEADPQAAALVESVNGGNQTVPTLLFADGSTLTNPSLGQVKAKLGR